MIFIESKILKELKNGDHAAFEKIFIQYNKQLYQFSLSYIKSENAAEDIVQDVFIKIWKNRKEIKTDTSFQSYLFTITLNSLRKYFNQLTRLNELKHDILFDSHGHNPDFDDTSNYQFMLDKLEEFINQMPEKRKEVFMKKKFEEKSLKEISEELNITTKTVEYHITEAMKYLRSEFEKLQVQGLVFFRLFFK